MEGAGGREGGREQKGGMVEAKAIFNYCVDSITAHHQGHCGHHHKHTIWSPPWALWSSPWKQGFLHY